ncbi:MAG: TIGR01841 family phasin [Roseiarcus sp.]|jgi:phasin
MATAPKKTAAVTPAPTAFDAPAPAAVEAPVPALSASLSEAAKALEAPVASLTELQGNLRSVVEKGLSETRATYAKAKTAADEASNALESSYAAAKAGVVAINAKALEALRANVDANFDFVKSVFAVKNVADYVALQGEFTRKQIDAITGQSKEIGALAQKLATEAAEPIKEQVAKTFKIAV